MFVVRFMTCVCFLFVVFCVVRVVCVVIGVLRCCVLFACWLAMRVLCGELRVGRCSCCVVVVWVCCCWLSVGFVGWL